MKPWRAITRFSAANSGGILPLLLCLIMIAGAGGCAPATVSGSVARAATVPADPVLQPLFSVYAQVTLQSTEQTAAQRFKVFWQREQLISGDLQDTAEIKTPLGHTQAKILINANRAQLTYPNGRVITEPNGEILAQRALGYALPIQALGYWVNGQAVPQINAEEQFDVYGGLSAINQLGWTIQYLTYYPNGKPEKMALYRPDGLQVEVDIRRWLPL